MGNCSDEEDIMRILSLADVPARPGEDYPVEEYCLTCASENNTDALAGVT